MEFKGRREGVGLLEYGVRERLEQRKEKLRSRGLYNWGKGYWASVSLHVSRDTE